MHRIPLKSFRACDRGKYTRSYDHTKLLATAAVTRKVDRCSKFSVSDMVPDKLNGKKFHDLLCVVVRVVAIDSILHGQLYIADCKDEGNTLKPYLPKKKTVVVLKMLVRECAWAPSLVHPRELYLPLTSRM